MVNKVQEKRTRRGNNEGSAWPMKDKDGKIIPNKWRGAISVDGIDGKKKRKTFTGKNRKEVLDKCKAALKKIEEGNYFNRGANITVSDWLDTWLNNYKKHKLKDGTFQFYKIVIETHLKPSIGHIKLAKLGGEELQAMYTSKLESGRSDGKGGLSSKSVRHIHTVLRGAMEQAVKNSLIKINPATATEPPEVRQKEMNFFTVEQIKTFNNAAKDERLFVAYKLAMATGLRRGELLGLSWDCVNLVKGTLTVKQQLKVVNNSIIIDDELKSKSAKRNISLPENITAMLKDHKTNQAKERLAWGEGYKGNPYNLLFTKEDGSFIDPRNFTKDFQRICKKANLPVIRVHDLRHTHASLLLSEGIHPKIVQERLGHSTISMTIDQYSHLCEGLQVVAAKKINDVF